jgi:hypothetical protein
MKGEWRLAYRSGEDPLDTTLQVELPCDMYDISELENYSRFAFGSDSEDIVLSAALADRSVVTRSEKQLHLPPGEELAVYVSSPLWVRIEAGKPARRLVEIPVYRPSDTWFGPNTLEGELCYSSRTFHRVQLEQVPIRPHRATTTVLVKNRADSMLSLERMQVPVTCLGLYQKNDGRLWTDDVIFTRSGADDFASVRTSASNSRIPGEEAARIAEPRRQSDENLILRAFSSIFG